jgi:hypothetical protein
MLGTAGNLLTPVPELPVPPPPAAPAPFALPLGLDRGDGVLLPPLAALAAAAFPSVSFMRKLIHISAKLSPCTRAYE